MKTLGDGYVENPSLILTSLQRLREENQTLRAENSVHKEQLEDMQNVLNRLEAVYKLFMERFDGCPDCNPPRLHDKP